MIQPLILLGLAGACLSACASPQYPITLPLPEQPLAMAAPPGGRSERDAGPIGYGRTGPLDDDPQPRAAPRSRVEQTELPSVLAQLQPQPQPLGAQPAPVQPAAESAPARSTASPPPPDIDTPQPTFAAAPSAPQAQVITVARGETMFDLAERYRTPIVAIIEANALQPPYELQPGQKLTIPPPLRYTTVVGDTIFGVGQRFSVDPRSLAIMNGTSIAKAVLPGTVLSLPPSVQDKGAQPEARGESPIPPGYRFTPPRGEAEPVQVAAATPRPTPPAVSRPAQPQPEPQRPPPTYSRPTPSPPPVYRRPEYQPPAVRPAAPLPSPPRPALSAPATAAVPSPAQVATAAKGRFVWPLRGEILSTFGPKGTGQRNDGINIAATQGSSVRAAAAGEVVYAGNQVPGFGNLVLLKHPGGWVTAYAHLDKLIVKNRDSVQQGQEVGHAGATGDVGRPQLHFEIRYAPTPNDKARPVDPEPLLP
jgi:murein DD-endopeptidase MepM/ murein hydrolase activator NlpD